MSKPTTRPRPEPAQRPGGADRLSRPQQDRPVLYGLLALVGVGLAIGVLAGLASLAGAKMAGLDGDAAAEAGAEVTGKQSMYLPTPTPTAKDRGPGPLISVGPQDPEETAESGSPSSGAGISLSAGQSEVSAMQQIDLSGTYAGGEGAVLQVQRKDGDSWSDFPVTVSVTGGRFSTYIQTSQTGDVQFRVMDTDTGKASNPVTVAIG